MLLSIASSADEKCRRVDSPKAFKIIRKKGMPFPRIKISFDTAQSGEATLSTSCPPFADELTPAELEQHVLSLYEELSPCLFRYALTIGKNRELAQETIQEVFLRYYTALIDGEKVESEKAWLFRVARNYVLDHLKGAAAKNCISAEVAEWDHLPDGRQDLEQAQLKAEVMGYALKLLSAREMECLQLRAEGFNYAEIAKALNVKAGTVGTMLLRGLKKIRAVVGERRQ